MFDVGKTYEITLTYDSSDDDVITHYGGCVVIEYTHPLLKVDHFGEERIINTASSEFISAKPK